MCRKSICLASLIMVLGLAGYVFANDADTEIPDTRGNKPVLDGVVDDIWSLSAENIMTMSREGTAPDSAADCSGSWWALWDWDYLYVLVDVNDEELVQDSGEAEGWNDDRVEIFIDVDNRKDAVLWGVNDYQYCFRWNNGEVETPVEFYFLDSGIDKLEGVEYAVATTEHGYLFEIALPWLTLTDEPPLPGQLIGIEVMIDDDDDGGGRDTQFSWYIEEAGAPHYPSLWGTAMLTAMPAPEPVNPGAEALVAHYEFENDVLDGSGNGNGGTVNGDPTFVDGMIGTALEFDGAGDYIDCGNNPILAITDAVSISAWIKVAAQGLDHKIGGNQDGANGGYKMTVFNNNRVEFEIRTAANSAVLNRNVAGGTEIEVDVWYHVVGVYSLADGYIRTYVNGAMDRELQTTQELGASPGALMIGCEPFSTGEYNFNGVMDDIRIYNKALSETEVMYLAGKRATPVDPGTDGLMAYYPLDIDALDATGNGYDGTINGDPQWVDGKVGGALEMDGGDFVDVPGAAEINPESITLATWVYFNTVDGADMERQDYLSRGDDYAFSLHEWGYRDNTEAEGKISAIVTSAGGWSVVAGATTVEADTWYHTALTYDLSNQMLLLYLDGEVDGELSLPAGLEHRLGGSLTIGTYNGRDLLGRIDEVVIYDRALSAGEVLYLAGFRPPIDPVIALSPVETMEASGDFGDILSINGIPVIDLIVGTTMFPDPPASEPQPAENADNFSLNTAACADNQPYMQTMFGKAVTTIFIFEKSGNDNGTMQALDAMGNPAGNIVVFSPADFAGTGYTGYGDQVAFGTVITSDIPIYGVILTATRLPAEGGLGIDPFCICAVPAP